MPHRRTQEAGGEEDQTHLEKQVDVARAMAQSEEVHAVVKDQSANGFDLNLTAKKDTTRMSLDLD